ncbi:MAG: LCP family protein [Oscillospiraceae bacterium]|nr:LCP family protein [Oscillospiraceae bacterium]
MTKAKKIRIFRDGFILLFTIVFACVLIRTMVKPMLDSQQPFVLKQGALEEDTSNYLLKPSEVPVYDGLELNQYIEGQYTVLALGMDEEGLNTDVMMLVVFDLAGGKMNILQIPRDSYVGYEYTNNATGKINSVYSEGTAGGTGINKVVSCVRDMFGIPIDSYIAIKCTDVAPVVDKMGGIPINVPEDIIYEADKIIYAGQQTLTGEQSEWFVRFRHDYLEGDIGRVKAQRYFLAAAMQKVKDLGTLKILKIYPTLSEYLMSDLEIGEIGKLSDFAQTIDMSNVTVRMVPGESLEPGVINEYYGWSIHKQETVDVLNEYFRPYQAEMSADELDIVEVKNTTSYYDDDVSNFQQIVDGETPSVPRNED